MRRILLSGVAATVVIAGSLRAQSSEFGIRGLGVPGRELSARGLALGGSGGLFDGESSLNPAALGTLTTVTALFTSSGDWRSTTNPAGSMSTRDTRFPQILVGGPIPHRPISIGISYSLYTDRDFTVVSDGTASPRGVPIAVHDTLSSLGGIDDLRIGGGWVVNRRLAVGGAVHLLTGSNRLASRRFWEDTTYQSPQDVAELSYAGVGFSVGMIWKALPHVEIAAAARHDGSLTIQRDSTGNGQVLFPTSTIGHVPMPTTLSGAIRLTPSRSLSVTGSVISRNWSVADSSLVAQGAPGARNTYEINGGVEWFRDLRRPLKYPLRLGARYATLPFLLVTGTQPREYGFSIGTGRRFAQERGGFDLSIEHLWRSQGSNYTESATLITFGISVRPGGVVP
ncbi:MAG TPA: hypothetical protein VID74_06170 [Gemmatimonadales bacterium]|jgi:hypothetical protein